MRAYAQYGLPVATLEPGESCTVEVKTNGLFRGQKLVMAAFMEEIRGSFKLKYSRLPLLNRENVIAYSNVTRVKSKRRTTVEYRDGIKNSFVRSYLPSSVVYVHTDPLSYITLLNMFIGDAAQMPLSRGGFSAAFFGQDVLSNGISVVSGHKVAIALRNGGDIQVKVHAVVFGIEEARRGS